MSILTAEVWFLFIAQTCVVPSLDATINSLPGMLLPVIRSPMRLYDDPTKWSQVVSL